MTVLPNYEEQIIGNVRYRVCSVFSGEKSLRDLLQSAIVDQVMRHLNDNGDNTVTKVLLRLIFPTSAAVAAAIALVVYTGPLG